MRWSEIEKQSVLTESGVYRYRTSSKSLSALTLNDVRDALISDFEVACETFEQDAMEAAARFGLTYDAFVEKLIAELQTQFGGLLHDGRLNIYREVYLKDRNDLWAHCLGASWTPRPETAQMYVDHVLSGKPYLISAWIEDQHVDWPATLIMRFNNSEEDEVRIFQSDAVNIISVEPRS